MCYLTQLINKIKGSTEDLQLETIQELLLKARQYKYFESNELLWLELTDILWTHLQVGLKRFDDQLLCATCFYTVLSFTNKQEIYMNKLLALIRDEFRRKKNAIAEYKNYKLPQVSSLMYGLFQSTFLTHKCTENIKYIDDVLKATFDMLTSMAYDYSKYTFIVFKTITSFKKVLGTKFQEIIYSKENVLKLLHLTNHNWENPITGVRDLNKTVFQTLVPLLTGDIYETILNEINEFYWNKAKYLMLSEIIEQYKANINILISKNYWVDGLLYSLHKPGLVSAGADMYFAIIKNLKSEDQWCTLFLNKIIEILNSNKRKAIENFCNYWCLTTFKKFPKLVKIFMDEMRIYDLEQTLHSCLCILKQANKLGLINKKWQEDTDVEIYILSGIEHCMPHIRISAFEIICVRQGKLMPTSEEYDLILKYLEHNISSDCTVLRISMLNNFKFFLQYLHTSYLNLVKNNHSFDNDALIQFYQKLQLLIVSSLDLNGNYQRKVTTVKICNIFFLSFTSTPKRRQKQISQTESSLHNYLKEHQKLVLFEEKFILKLLTLMIDPGEDIRENTGQLLLDHYSKEISSLLLNSLIKDAQSCISSKFFYEISCGQSLFKLITSLLIKENYKDTVFQTVEEVFYFAFEELHSEHKMKTDIVKSIETGKQLHSLLGILLEILRVSKQNSYEIKLLNEKIVLIIEILKHISEQFAWEQEPATSSDFSKMSDVVQNMIISSGYNPLDKKDFIKISGLEQIVLNCLWLNVKASCDLAAFLIEFLNEKQIDECEKCLTIIIQVLGTSRHKGAIEAAGAALGRAIQYLTSQPEDSSLSQLPSSLLQCKLKELISYASTASITRRGAGLSIMVHRIVSSDMRKGKPLFHYFMETILETCNSLNDIPNKLDDNQKDLPKAIYIHFLTRIVTDSSLASDMMYYSVDLAEIAFSNLTSTLWQIRNAALQLYGALIPKLIGQKKASGTDDETVATVACDEFRTHSPKLWRHIKESLANTGHEDKVQAHSNLMPILNVLANLAKRYNFSFNDEMDFEILESLFLLLGSPIFTVRRLTAKCIFNLYHLDIIFEAIMRKRCSTENFLHGSLLLIANCSKHYGSTHQGQLDNLIKDYNKILSQGEHSYVSRLEYDKLVDKQYSLLKIKQTLDEARDIYAPGIFHWANARCEKYINTCAWEDIPELVKIILKATEFELYCKFILRKIETDNSIPTDILIKTAIEILSFGNIGKSFVIWKILYTMSFRIDFGKILDHKMLNYLDIQNVTYRRRYSLPFFATIASKLPANTLIYLSNTIFSISDPATSDIDMRHIAALANNELAKAFCKIPDSIKVTTLKSAIVLLQDEDEDVRMLSIKFYSNLINSNVLWHPYLCMTKLMDFNFLHTLFNKLENCIQQLCEELSEVIGSYSNFKTDDEYNPFSNDSKNIYFEVDVVRCLIDNIQTNLK